MSNKDRVCVEIFHRDELTLGVENEQKYGLARFHWAILIRSKDMKRIGASTSFDVSDAAINDPISFVDLNPNRDWKFRIRSNVDPFRTGHFLGAIVIGKVPPGTTTNDIQALLARVPLPLRAQPDQNCVSWTMDAIRALQAAGIVVEGTNVDEIFNAAVLLGRRTMAQGISKNREDMFLTPAGKKM